MKKALVVATVVSFINFERNDIELLQQMEYEVHCATNFNNENEKTKDINVIRHQIDFERNPFCKQTIVAYRQLKKLIEEEQFELIHCHTPVAGVLTRLIAQKYRKKNVKVLYTAHGFHFFKGAPVKNWLLYYPIEWFMSWYTDVLITINTEDYGRAKKHFHSRKVKYIPGVGVNLDKFSNKTLGDATIREKKCSELGIDPSKFILMSAGEHSSRKNHVVVIEALKQLNNNNIVYLLVGQGPLKEHYQNLIEKYELKDNVIMPGYRLDINELCKIVDCFIHPSVREGLGIAPLEAMASGLPLISADINGIKDYTEQGKTGICINPKSVEQVAEAIERMYVDEVFRKQCGEYNMQVVKKYDLRNVKRIMREIYTSI